MKIIALLFLSTIALSAQASQSLGYLYSDGGSLIYAGFTKSNTLVSFDLEREIQFGSLTPRQALAMKQCMGAKYTSAIEVNQAGGSQMIRPGLSTNNAKFSVDCIVAPGFYTTWLSMMR